ncbi:MAG: hypothetical protein ACREX8_01725, partial [Gammaproteobacteria bacterium]
RRGGRKRGADPLAVRLHEALRQPRLRQDPLVEETMGAQALRLLATLDTECVSVDQLGQATAEAFAQHPDYQIITSFTGLGDMTGARVLTESQRPLLPPPRARRPPRRRPAQPCSTACSVASITAYKPARPTARPRPSQHPTHGLNQPPLDT